MYRITKVLNHNTILAVRVEDNQECMIMGKGVGFGKKISERIEVREEDTVYFLKEPTERGNARDIIKSVSTYCIVISNEVLNEAEKIFGKIDRSILFPMADHIAYAVKRIRNHEQISNPLTEDIRALFHMEYKAAQCVAPILKKQFQVEVDEDEIGYIALHVHSAIEDEKVSQAMQIALVVRECVSLVEEEMGRKINVMSLSYNRLMNHVRYMAARVLKKESLKLSMNDYMKVKFPESYKIAEKVCEQTGNRLKCTLEEAEIGYLAMHIERVTSGELDA